MEHFGVRFGFIEVTELTEVLELTGVFPIMMNQMTPMGVMSARQAFQRSTVTSGAVKFGNTAPNGTPAQKEFYARLKGIEESLKDGSLKIIAANKPTKNFVLERNAPIAEEVFITGTLQKPDGQRFTFEMSNRSLRLENSALGIKYDFRRSGTMTSVRAYDARSGKFLAYDTVEYDVPQKKGKRYTPTASMREIIAQVNLIKKVLLQAVEAFSDNRPASASLKDTPPNRDF